MPIGTWRRHEGETDAETQSVLRRRRGGPARPAHARGRERRGGGPPRAGSRQRGRSLLDVHGARRRTGGTLVGSFNSSATPVTGTRANDAISRTTLSSH